MFVEELEGQTQRAQQQRQLAPILSALGAGQLGAGQQFGQFGTPMGSPGHLGQALGGLVGTSLSPYLQQVGSSVLGSLQNLLGR